MKRATALFLFLFVAAISAQQTGLTDAQQKSAEAEVPRLMQILELKPGMTIADVGAGFGAWTMRFSRALGPKGRVLANDIGAQQLAFLRESIKKEGVTNRLPASTELGHSRGRSGKPSWTRRTARSRAERNRSRADLRQNHSQLGTGQPAGVAVSGAV